MLFDRLEAEATESRKEGPVCARGDWIMALQARDRKLRLPAMMARVKERKVNGVNLSHKEILSFNGSNVSHKCWR